RALGEARRAARDLRTASPCIARRGWGSAGGPGVSPETGGLCARRAPPDSAPTLQSSPLLPSGLTPPFPVTNRALLGYGLDETTSPLSPDLHLRAGQLADAGKPRDWVNGEAAQIERVADTFGQEPSHAGEWDFP